MDKTFYITTPIYYPSAKPHMGHAYSSIIADFFARFKFIDDYQVYEDIRDDGILKRYYQSGNVKEQKQYLSNKLNGDYLLFHDNINNVVQLKGKYKQLFDNELNNK